jgi:PII-like signaling protein
MQGSFLRFYVHEGQRHRHDVVWEWLLMQANKLGIRGGSAFKAMAGFGRHHLLAEEKFFDLAGSSVIEIEFVVTNSEAQQLLNLIHREKLALFYAYIPARFGVIDISTADPPSVTSAS